MVEYTFFVLEADGDANSLKDVMATLPNKTRLTPLSIMVCNTISAVWSWTLLKVLFDSESTAMFISHKGLPRHCKPCQVTKTHSVNTLVHRQSGGGSACNMIARTRQEWVIEQHKALVFDGNFRYDLILCADFLTKSGIYIKCSSGTMEWFNCKLPMWDPISLWPNPLRYTMKRNKSLAGTGTTQTVMSLKIWMPADALKHGLEERPTQDPSTYQSGHFEKESRVLLFHQYRHHDAA